MRRIAWALLVVVVGCGGGGGGGDDESPAPAPAVGGGGGGGVPAPGGGGGGGQPVPSGPLSVALTVTEPSGVARPAEPVTAGVPFARDHNLMSVAGLGVFDGATQLPAQFRVLSRWEGAPDDATRPIRWVLADFQIDLAANETRTVVVQPGGAPPATPLTVDLTNPAFAAVQTGAMEMRVNRLRGNLIDRVAAGGIVVAEDATPLRDRSGFTLTDAGGTVWRGGLALDPDVVVEEAGPLRVCLRVRTSLVNGAGATLRPGEMRVTHRIHFYANHSFVRVHTQLENNSYANGLDFDSAALDVPHALAGLPARRVYQGHAVNNANDESQNFAYTIVENGVPVATGARHAGWTDAATANGSVTAGVRWFWQNYEKALRVAADRISVELWPAEGQFGVANLYRFGGARRKSHEVLLQFRPGAAGDPGAVHTRLCEPVVPRAAALRYWQTEALGMTDPGVVAFGDARMDAAYARYNELLRKRVGATAPDAGAAQPRNLVEAKEQRYRIGTWDTADWYGWAHFGDNSWGDGYSSNHYDQAGFFLVHYLRLGDRAFWDVAEPHVRQAAEWGQIWGESANPFEASISRYEKTAHGEQPEQFLQAASHNWIRRLVLYYWLTGNEAAREAALFNAQGLWRYFYQAFDITNPASFDLAQWSPLLESRFMTWTLDNVLEIYAMTGDVQWRTMSEQLVQCLAYAFQQQGHIGGTLMIHYGSEPLIRFHRASANAPVRLQALNLLRDLIGVVEADRRAPQGAGAAYQPAVFADDWDGGTPGPESYETMFNGFAASLYGYVGWVDGNAAFLQIAHRLWADGIYYPDYLSPFPTRDPRNENAFDAWSWRTGNFPGSEEKVWSRTTRAGLPYLWVMSQP